MVLVDGTVGSGPLASKKVLKSQSEKQMKNSLGEAQCICNTKRQGQASSALQIES